MISPAEPPSQSHAADSGESHALGSHRLGAHVLGQRVVVRRILPGLTGPTGGPAFTDTLGECLTWADGLCEVRTEDGTVVTIAITDIVSGKPVPPRPSIRLRTPARTVHLHSNALFPTLHTAPLGEWVLRSGGDSLSGRATKRGNSVLATGDPGMPLPAAADAVRAHYTGLGLAPLAHVVCDSPEEEALVSLGWVDAGGHAEAQVAPLSRVLRALPAPPPLAELEELTADVALVRVGEDARVRVALSGDWAAVADLWVAEGRRRTGLARAVLAEALDWAASRGATTAHLQVESDNLGAVQLYRTLGFSTHHAYRFLTLP